MKLRLYLLMKTVMTYVLLVNSAKNRKNNWLICKNIWNVTVTCCLCLVSAVQKIMYTESNHCCYLQLPENEILSHCFEKKPNQYIFSKHVDIQLFDRKTFLVEQNDLIPSWKRTRSQKQNDSFSTETLIVLTKRKAKNSHVGRAWEQIAWL